MAIDFPASPTVGQTYTYGGVIYVYTAQGVWATGSGSFAPLESPIFTGDPRAPTPTTADNDTSIATTAYTQAAIAAAIAAASAFPAGTLMLFQQTAAPTGWTKQTAHNDKALRLVSGTASTGGSWPFTDRFTGRLTDAFTISTTYMPSHNHPSSVFYADPSGASYGGVYGGPTAGVGSMVAYEGGNGAHAHSFNMDVQYVDCIIASKN